MMLDPLTSPPMPEIKSKGQEHNAQGRRYKSFCVQSNGSPTDTCIDLNKQLDSLLKFGWVIERIDCHDNICGVWNDSERKYYPTKDYIILAYIEK